MKQINRSFTRREPTRDARSLYIFCEGKKREYQYFKYFRGLDSRINVEVYPLEGHEDNSPTGLLKLATRCFHSSEDNPYPKYELLKGDEVWFVVDTDRWGEKITQLRNNCSQQGWHLVQSNPCFEVWLYYHLYDEPANFHLNEVCSTWKEYLSSNIEGGFNSRKHTILVGSAIENARVNYLVDGDAPAVGSSSVYKLADVIYSFCKDKIEKVRHRIR